ncbi:hypothetical protein [Roseibium sp.]
MPSKIEPAPGVQAWLPVSPSFAQVSVDPFHAPELHVPEPPTTVVSPVVMFRVSDCAPTGAALAGIGTKLPASSDVMSSWSRRFVVVATDVGW